MASEFNFQNGCLEWCTELPSSGFVGRESPVFPLKGSKWCFLIVLQILNDYWLYALHLRPRYIRRPLESCRIRFEVGFKNETTLSLDKGEFNVLEYDSGSVWWFYTHMFPHEKGSSIKFRFYKEADPLSKTLITESQATASKGVIQESQMLPESKANIDLEVLSRDFSKMLDESSWYDVKIQCGDKTFQAHKNVLEMRSAVFSAMLKSDMVEGKTGFIKIEDIESSIFQSFLQYLYSGMLPKLNVDIAKRCYEVSDRYGVDELKKTCSEFLINELSIENVCEILILSDLHSDRDFRKNVISYMVDKKIPECDEYWNNFCENYPKLALKIVNFYIKKNRSK